MRKNCLLVASLLIVLCAGTASANSFTDPGVTFKPGTGSTCITITPLGVPPCAPPRVGLNFPIPLPTGGGTTVFKNNTGMIIRSLTLLLTPGPQGPLSMFTCGLQQFGTGPFANYFTSCNYVRAGGPSGVDLVFGGGTGIPFSTPGHIVEFALDFNGWPTGSTFTGVASTVPEPATMSFMLLGMGAVALKRRMFRG